jgi:hypothetical protein
MKFYGHDSWNWNKEDMKNQLEHIKEHVEIVYQQLKEYFDQTQERTIENDNSNYVFCMVKYDDQKLLMTPLIHLRIHSTDSIIRGRNTLENREFFKNFVKPSFDKFAIDTIFNVGNHLPGLSLLTAGLVQI